MKNTKEILKQLVSINSVFPNEANVAVWIEEFIKELGFKTQRQKDLSNHWSDWRDEINKISELGRDIQEKNKQY